MYERTLLCAALLSLGSCAIIVNDGEKDELALLTEPRGASYELSNGETGTTPAWVELKPKSSMAVTFRLDGYESKTVLLEREVRPLAWANFAWLVTGVVGAGIAFGIDFGTGAAWRFVQPFTVELTPIGEAARP
jgi:hypothetical protein